MNGLLWLPDARCCPAKPEQDVHTNTQMTDWPPLPDARADVQCRPGSTSSWTNIQDLQSLTALECCAGYLLPCRQPHITGSGQPWTTFWDDGLANVARCPYQHVLNISTSSFKCFASCFPLHTDLLG